MPRSWSAAARSSIAAIAARAYTRNAESLRAASANGSAADESSRNANASAARNRTSRSGEASPFFSDSIAFGPIASNCTAARCELTGSMSSFSRALSRVSCWASFSDSAIARTTLMYRSTLSL